MKRMETIFKKLHELEDQIDIYNVQAIEKEYEKFYQNNKKELRKIRCITKCNFYKAHAKE